MKVTLVRGAKSYRVLHSKKSSLPRRVSFDRRIDKISNNGLFMAPHLVRAQNAFKDITIHAFHHTHTHTHTHTLQIHALLVMDWYRSVCRGKEIGFQF